MLVLVLVLEIVLVIVIGLISPTSNSHDKFPVPNRANQATTHYIAKPMDRKNRRLQFNLRTLLWLMLVVGAFFGGWQTHEWQRQRELDRANPNYTGIQGPIQRSFIIDAVDVTELITVPDSPNRKG